MTKPVAIIGAGVSGLTCGMVFAERGYRVTIFAEETGAHTTSAAAGAIWYPYDAEPPEKVIAWARASYDVFCELSRDRHSGVSLIELRTFSRAPAIAIPPWAISLGARRLRPSEVEIFLATKHARFKSAFALDVPLIDTTIYLDYLAQRFISAGGEISGNVRFAALENVPREFPLVVNCSGIGAKLLVPDPGVEPHRGQVAVVSKLDLSYAIVSDDAPLMYAIPRTNDCVFGGTNELSDNRASDPSARSRIVAECSRILDIGEPKVIADRVGLRPFRKSGVRVEAGFLRDGRPVIHNYGHGGAGFTVSWACAMEVFALAGDNGSAQSVHS